MLWSLHEIAVALEARKAFEACTGLEGQPCFRDLNYLSIFAILILSRLITFLFLYRLPGLPSILAIFCFYHQHPTPRARPIPCHLSAFNAIGAQPNCTPSGLCCRGNVLPQLKHRDSRAVVTLPVVFAIMVDAYSS